jgi:hypothetical protein
MSLAIQTVDVPKVIEEVERVAVSSHVHVGEVNVLVEYAPLITVQ